MAVSHLEALVARTLMPRRRPSAADVAYDRQDLGPFRPVAVRSACGRRAVGLWGLPQPRRAYPRRMGIEVRPVTGRRDDFASLMVTRKPGGSGCVCMAYRNSSLDMPRRIAHMRALCDGNRVPASWRTSTARWPAGARSHRNPPTVPWSTRRRSRMSRTKLPGRWSAS